MAPEAVERAALEEDGRPDSRPVMHGETLDIEYRSRRHRPVPNSPYQAEYEIITLLIYQISDILQALF
jgi:hypothetical protein